MCHVVVNLLRKPWLGWNPFIWSEGSCLLPDMYKSGFTITFVKENVCVYYYGRPLTLRANPMFTSLVMKLEPCGAHTTGLHWSSNSITPLINAQMLLADPPPHSAFCCTSLTLQPLLHLWWTVLLSVIVAGHPLSLIVIISAPMMLIQLLEMV